MEKPGLKLTDLPDTDLIRLALEQNQAAYIVLYTRYNAGVRAHISKYVSQTEDAEDITLESFQKLNIITDNFCHIYSFAVLVIISSGLDSSLYTNQISLFGIRTKEISCLSPGNTVDKVSTGLPIVILAGKPSVTCHSKLCNGQTGSCSADFHITCQSADQYDAVDHLLFLLSSLSRCDHIADNIGIDVDQTIELLKAGIVCFKGYNHIVALCHIINTVCEIAHAPFICLCDITTLISDDLVQISDQCVSLVLFNRCVDDVHDFILSHFVHLLLD